MSVAEDLKKKAPLEVLIDLERNKRQAKRFVNAEEQPPHPAPCTLTLAELFALPAPQYLVDRWIPEQGLIQVVGAPGTLKTFFILSVALAVASGALAFFDYAIGTQGPVLYIVAEGAGAFQYRVRAWCTEHQVDPLALPFHTLAMAVNLRDPTFQEELAVILAKLHPVLIVVDTLSRCTPGADENSSQDMGEVVNFCTKLHAAERVAVVLVHHPTKSDPSGSGRGSSVVVGALDAEIRIQTEDDEDLDADVQGSRPITVTCTKQKDDARPPLLKLTGHVVPVVDEYGRAMAYASDRAITSIVLRATPPEDAAEHIEKARVAELKVDVQVLRVMKEYPEVTNQKALRGYVEIKLTHLTASVRRILLAKWAVGGSGKPFTLTSEGERVLSEEVPF